MKYSAEAWCDTGYNVVVIRWYPSLQNAAILSSSAFIVCILSVRLQIHPMRMHSSYEDADYFVRWVFLIRFSCFLSDGYVYFWECCPTDTPLDDYYFAWDCLRFIEPPCEPPPSESVMQINTVHGWVI